MNVAVFQPGLIFYEVMLGCFKASGRSFHHWCKENDVSHAAACAALKGSSAGDKGAALIEKMVDAAGPQVVATAYRARIERHAAEVAA